MRSKAQIIRDQKIRNDYSETIDSNANVTKADVVKKLAKREKLSTSQVYRILNRKDINS
jgi:hypothetical protein